MIKHSVSIFLMLSLIVISSCSTREELSKGDFFEEELKQAKGRGVKKDDLPFVFIRDGNKAALLIHGLTATPWEVKEIGIYLAQKNITVYAPILEGHGINPYALERTKWDEWYKEVENSYDALSQNADYVYVIGVSMGGDLALLLGADKDPKGIVLISTPIWLNDRRSEFAWLYKNLRNYRFVERNLSEEHKGHYYESIPAQSVNELMKIIWQVRKNLKEVDEPLLIMQSTNDHTIDPRSADYIYNNVGSGIKSVSWKEGPHVIFEEKKNEAFEEIYKFINEN